MWISYQALVDSFDTAFDAAYGNGERDELANLAKLFGPVAIAGYAQALVNGLDPGSSAAVDVAWIDKRPIAWLEKDGVGAELGDMMLVVHEHDPSGLWRSRACILEVKQSPSDPIPPVPVTGGGSSTDRQFKILREWPEIYGIKKTATNRSYLLEKIVTQQCASDLSVLAQAWYVAVKPPVANGEIYSPWMAAPAVQGAEFEHTLGELFARCARGESVVNIKVGNAIAVGRSFEPGHVLQNPPGWDALINAIISVAREYSMPRRYFGKNARRRYIAGGAMVGPAAAVADSPLSAAWHMVSGIVFAILLALVSVLVLVLSGWGAPKRKDDDPNQKAIMEERFPILFLQVMHGESMREGG